VSAMTALSGWRRERVAEQELGELALSEWYYGWCAGGGIVGLHLHALAEIHKRFVDLACLCKSSTGRFSGASALGS